MKEANRSFPELGAVKLFSLVVLLLLALGTCFLLTAVPAKAADVTIAEYGSNPVYDPPSSSDKAYYPCVLYDANQFSGHGASFYYKMWYADGQGQYEAVTYSNDGITWTAPPPSSMAGTLASGYHAQTIFIPGGYSAIGGTYYYKIWYWDSAVHDVPYTIDGIRTADSVDGENWTNDTTITQNAGSPLVTANDTHVPLDWNRGTYGPVSIHYNSAATNIGTNPFDYTFAMYYDGTTGGVESMGLGYSADGNTDWHGYGSGPVLNYGNSGDWDSDYACYGTVIHGADGVWHMWYSGSGPSGGANQGIGHATSSDGLGWTKDPDNPLFSIYQGVAWRNSRCYTPSVLYSPTRFDGHGAGAVYKMWFTGEASSTSNRTIGYAASPPTTVWVDTTYSPGSAGSHTFGYDAFNTVQGGINGVATGGTVNVAAGTYTELLQPIYKHLTVTGADKNTTIINGGDPYSVEIHATDVSFSGFTVMNPGYTGGSDATGIVIEPPTGSPSNIHVYDNIIRDIGKPDTACVSYGRVGINIGGPDGPVEVDHNEIFNIRHNGSVGDVWANGFSIWGASPSQPANNVNVHDNYIHDIYCPLPKAAGISTQADVKGLKLLNNRIENTKDYGIETRGGSQDSTFMQGNQIDGSSSLGIATGIKCCDPFEADLSGNTVTACQIGVLVEEHDPTWGGTSASVQPNVHLNRIFGNTTFGLQNTITGDTNAPRNWWGSVYGPWSASHTSGDRISGGAASTPWCTNSACTEIVSFPSQVTANVTAGVFAIPVDSAESSTPYVKAADQVIVNVTQGAATHTVTVPTGVSMASSGGGSFSTADLVAAYVEPAALSGFATGTIVRAGLHWGLTGGTLDTSSPITIRLFVGPGLEGLRLNIIRSVTGNSGWTGDGIATASAPVSGGYVTFEASKTSYYAAITPPRTNPVKFAVTASVSGGHGTVSPATQMVNSAGTATMNIKADAGYHTASVRDNGTSVTPMPTTYTINNITENHDVVVTFAQDQTQNSTWYLAEGTTAWGFSTYISIENPNTSAVHASLTYMTGSGNVSGGTITLPAQSQTTVNPADTLGDKDFSTRVVCTEGKPIAVDRTMTWTGPGAASPEGHSSVGVTSPATAWYLPEGSSAWGFECWLLIQNPNASAATCTVTYMIEGEGPRTVNHIVPANRRQSFNMASDIGSKDASIKVVSNIPVIPERAMYRNNRREGSDSIGTTAAAPDYYLAEGTTAWGFTTYVLIQNPAGEASNVTITYMTPSGKKVQPSFSLAGNSRKTIRVNDVAGMANTDFSTQVQGTKPIIAERSMYWGEGTALGEACHDSIGMNSAHTTFYLPDGQTSEGRETWTLVQNPNASAVTVEVSYLKAGGGAVTLTSTIPANSRMTFNMADKVPSGRASIVVTSNTSEKKIMVERSMYWNSRGAGTDTIGAYVDGR